MRKTTCDFSHNGEKVQAVDCHSGEVFFCEAHRSLVFRAVRNGVLDDPNYTIQDMEEEL